MLLLMLKKTYGRYRDEVSGQCRIFHNEELRDLYRLCVTRIVKYALLQARHIARKGGTRNIWYIGKLLGKCPVEKKLSR
jgi:hypothetical protein